MMGWEAKKMKKQISENNDTISVVVEKIAGAIDSLSELESEELDQASIKVKLEDIQKVFAEIVEDIKSANPPLIVKKDNKSFAYEFKKFNKGFKMYVNGVSSSKGVRDDSQIEEARKIFSNSFRQAGKITKRIRFKLNKEIEASH